jgi:hypothetical protein
VLRIFQLKQAGLSVGDPASLLLAVETVSFIAFEIL